MLIEVLARQRRAMVVLAKSDARQRAMFNQAAVGIVQAGLDGRLMHANRRACELLGYTETELLRLTFADVTHPDDRVASRAVAQRLLAEGGRNESAAFEKRYLRKDGSVLWALLSVATVRGDNGAPDYFITSLQDITERKRAEEELRLSAQAFEHMADGVVVTDPQQRILSINKAFSSITGYQPEEVVGRTPRTFQSGRHDAAFYSGMWEEIGRAGHWRGEFWDRRKNGEIYPELLSISAVKDAAGAVTHYVGVCTDISSLKHYEQQLHHQAHHDALTGLPNRALYQERFREAIVRARRHETGIGVMFIDLDRFKSINDSLGHPVGDLLLKGVAERLTAIVRETDTVARFGGDEFALLVDDLRDTQAVATVAQEAVLAA